MSAELIAILAVGVSQTLLMATLAGFLLASQRRLDSRIAELARIWGRTSRSSTTSCGHTSRGSTRTFGSGSPGSKD